MGDVQVTILSAEGSLRGKDIPMSEIRAAQQETPADAPRPRCLVAFFSRAGLNFWDGEVRNLEIGNTKVLAEKIAARLGADTFEIVPVHPYPADPNEAHAQCTRELADGIFPELTAPAPAARGYDVVLVGFPVWCEQVPPVVQTYLKSAGLTDQLVLPFTTWSGSPKVEIESTFTNLAPEATTGVPFSVRGENIHEAATDSALEEWLASANLI
ncbi:hypothetical protein HMPREF9237_00350 [Actinotignum schaalii FB123-CNA-2]|uniref:Flavodoxin-like domain-containing protein n=2 Tax=Actinomycetaceae TaxID=2049 RepID=S2W5B4_9ACTO|nr:hypothetical protein HMPREF9237_00350 [Actinotignum schaalii FB123-CNA-2]